MSKNLKRSISFLIVLTMIITNIFNVNAVKGATESKVFTETFTNLNLSGSSYKSGSFEGDNGVTWNYTEGKYTGSYSIDGKGILLNKKGSIVSDKISGGIKSFSVQLSRPYTSSKVRQVELLINGEVKGKSQIFGGSDVHTFILEDIDVTGDFTLEIRTAIKLQVVLDNLSWTSYSDGGGNTTPEKLPEVQADPAPGQVVPDTDVELKSTTPGTIILYSLNNKDYQPYTAKINIDKDMTIWAKNTLPGSQAYTDSDISQFDYAIRPEGLVTIKDVKLVDNDTIVKVEGIITTKGYKTYMQDGTGGIRLKTQKNEDVTIEEGYKVKITGTKGDSYGIAQITDYTVEVLDTETEVPNPQIVKINDLQDTLKSQLVKIENVIIQDINNNGTTYFKDAEDNSIGVYKLPQKEGIKKGDKVHLIGNVSTFKSNYQLYINDASDMIKVDEGTGTTDYYENAKGKTGAELKAALNDIIDDPTKLSYSQAYEALRFTDADPNDPSRVILFYSGRSEDGAKKYNKGQGWNREHTWAKSHGDFGTATGPGSDLHNLRPTDVDVNKARDHYDFDEVEDGQLVDETTDCYVNKSTQLFEPSDRVKGDVARILFYMAVRYEEGDELDLELSNSKLSIAKTVSKSYGEHGVLSTLLKWHKADPVDAFEQNRNEVIYNDYQHNRNPFIDHPEWAEMIWGDGGTVTPPAETITIEEARSKENGTVVTVKGIAVNQSGIFGGKGFYIQDDTAGIYVFQSNIDITEKENLKIKGTIGEYNGEKQLSGNLTVEKLGTVETLEPKEVMISELSEANVGMLYKIKGLTIAELKKANDYGTVEFKGNKVDDSIVVRIDNRTGYNYDEFIKKYSDGKTIDVVGVLGNFKTTLQLKPRKAEDITAVNVIDNEAPLIEHLALTSGNIANDLVITSTVTDNRVVSAVTLYYKTKGTSEFKERTMVADENTYSATIQKSELDQAGLMYYIKATDGTNVSYKPEDIATPYEVAISVTDITGPEITSVEPANQAIFATSDEVKGIRAEFNDQSGINKDSAKLFLNDADVTSSATYKDEAISYMLDNPLSNGEHTAKIVVKDQRDNETSYTWTFSIGQKEYNTYFGQLHSHTTYSDGKGTGDEAFTWARDKGKADFFAITDHSNWFDEDDEVNETIANVSDSTSKTWKDMHAVADKYNEDGKFVALAGYEMTWSGSTGGWGHINTFYTPWFASRSNSKMDLPAYYKRIGEDSNSISQLNHPGKTFGDFSDFGFYSESADNAVNLIEVGNGEGPIRGSGYFPSYEYYTRALDKGWHVAPANNQDNHKANWVTSNEARTVVLSDELTRQSIHEGIKDMRTYATEDSNLEISYKVNGAMMGAQLDEPDNLNIAITVKDPDAADHINRIELISNGGVIAASKEFDSNVAIWNFETQPKYTYYYVKVVQDDQDIAVTAPVWTAKMSPIGLSKVVTSQDIVEVNKAIDIEATVFNNAETILSEATVKYYIHSISNQNLIGETTVQNITQGATGKAVLNWTPDKTGNYKIYAVTTLTVDGAEKISTVSTEVDVMNKEDIVKVVIDAGHVNHYVSGSYAGKMTELKNMLKSKKIMAIEDDKGLTDADLEDASILVITSPQPTDYAKYKLLKSKLSPEEIETVRKFVQRGGNLIITTRADYKDGEGDYQNSVQGNKLLEAIGSNIRINDTQVIDNEKNGGQPYRLMFNTFTSNKYNLTSDSEVTNHEYSFYSGASIMLKENADDSKVDFLVKGHETTEISDADKKGDFTPTEKGQVYVLAAEELGNKGKVIVSGSTFFSDFEMLGDNRNSNIQITDNIIEWMRPKKIIEQKSIAEVRIDENGDGTPDLLGKTYSIEGYVTSESEAYSRAQGRKNAFFEVMYVQDATGGITVFGVSDKAIPIGTKVRVTGQVQTYDGDTELELNNETKDVIVLDEPVNVFEPKQMSTHDAMEEANEGWLVKVKGTVTSINTDDDNALFIDDGSGIARVFLDGYIDDGSGDKDKLGKWDSTIKVGDTVSAIGLASEDPKGSRLRVRNAAEIVKEAVVPDMPLEVKSVEAVDMLGNQVSEFNLNDMVVIKATVSSVTAEDVKGMMIIKLVDSDEKPYGLAFMPTLTFKPATDTLGTLGFIIAGVKAGTHKAKVYIWNNWDEMKPLSEIGEINFTVKE